MTRLWLEPSFPLEFVLSLWSLFLPGLPDPAVVVSILQACAIIEAGFPFLPAKTSSFRVFHKHQRRSQNFSNFSAVQVRCDLKHPSVKSSGNNSTRRLNFDINHVARETWQKKSMCIVNSFSVPHLEHVRFIFLFFYRVPWVYEVPHAWLAIRIPEFLGWLFSRTKSEPTIPS